MVKEETNVIEHRRIRIVWNKVQQFFLTCKACQYLSATVEFKSRETSCCNKCSIETPHNWLAVRTRQTVGLHLKSMKRFSLNSRYILLTFVSGCHLQCMAYAKILTFFILCTFMVCRRVDVHVIWAIFEITFIDRLLFVLCW